MSYYSEAQEVRTTVPTYVEYRTTTDGLPEGYMIAQDGKKFYPRYYFDKASQYSDERIHGWAYFDGTRNASIVFVSYDEAKAFILGWVAFLQWGGFAIPAPDPVEEAQSKLRRSEAARRHNFDVLFDLRRISWEAPMHWREEYRQCSIAALRRLAQERGIDTAGKKPHLIEALVADREQEVARQMADTEAMIARNNRDIARLQGMLKTGCICPKVPGEATDR